MSNEQNNASQNTTAEQPAATAAPAQEPKKGWITGKRVAYVQEPKKGWITGKRVAYVVAVAAVIVGLRASAWFFLKNPKAAEVAEKAAA